MKAIRLNEYGGTENLKLEEIDKPQAGPGEILIKVAAAGINYADTMLRAGNYLMKPELPITMGFEVAGTVETVSAKASHR